MLKSKLIKNITALFPSVGTFVVCCYPAFEAHANSTKPSSIPFKKTIEHIVVTAQKRVENIQDVAVSLTVLDTEQFEKNGYRQFADFGELIPNLQINNDNDAGSTLLLRGVGSASRNIGIDSRVGIYLDGVYLGQSIANNQDISNLERIEVLRGPQGTLFGKNNISGAVHLITKAPENEFSGRLTATLGSLNTRQINGSVNIPITDNLRAKVSLNQYTRDGYIRNEITNSLLNEQDSHSYRAILSGELSQTVDFKLSIDKLSSDRLSYDGQPITDTFGQVEVQESPERDVVSFNIDPTEDREVGGEILTVNWALNNNFTVKSITGHRFSENNFIEDFDFSTQEIATLDFFDEYEQFSQEFQFVSPEGKFQYLIGSYFYYQEAKTNSQVNVFDGALTGITGVARSDAEFLASIGNPQGIGLVQDFQSGTLSNEGSIDNENIALFFNSSYQVTDKFSIDFGLRYTYESIEVDWTVSNIDAITGASVIPALGIANGRVDDRQTYNDLSPRLVLNYQINNNVNSYFSYSTGYKSGGYNVSFLTQDQFDAGIEFEEETVESFELGFKGSAFDHALVFRSALFIANYDDFQVNQFINLESGASTFALRNAAEVGTKGAEFEFTYSLANIEFTGSAALLDAEFDDFINGGSQGQDLSGSSLPNIPDYTYNLGLNYFSYSSALNTDFTFSVDYNYRSSFNSDLENREFVNLANGNELPVGEVDGYGIVNFSVEILPKETGLSLSLWVRNVADENATTQSGRRSFFGTRRSFFVEPRTAGATLSYEF